MMVNTQRIFSGLIYAFIPFALVVFLGQSAFQEKYPYYKVYPFIRSLGAAGSIFKVLLSWAFLS